MWKTKVELAEGAKRRGKEAEKTAQQNTRLYPSKRGQKFGCQVNILAPARGDNAASISPDGKEIGGHKD